MNIFWKTCKQKDIFSDKLLKKEIHQTKLRIFCEEHTMLSYYCKDFPPLCCYSKAGVKYILILMFLVYPLDASSEVATGCFLLPTK